jgi:hypothetical protein
MERPAPASTRFRRKNPDQEIPHALRTFRRPRPRIRHHPPRHPRRGATTSAPPATGRSSPTTRAATASSTPPRRAASCACASTTFRRPAGPPTSICGTGMTAISGPPPGNRWASRSTATPPPAATAPATPSSPPATATSKRRAPTLFRCGADYECWLLRIHNTRATPGRLSAFTYCEFANNWSTTQDLVNLQFSQYCVKAQVHENRMMHVSVLGNLPEVPHGLPEQRSEPPPLHDPAGHVEPAASTRIASSSWDAYRGYDRPQAVERGACGQSLRRRRQRVRRVADGPRAGARRDAGAARW